MACRPSRSALRRAALPRKALGLFLALCGLCVGAALLEGGESPAPTRRLTEVCKGGLCAEKDDPSMMVKKKPSAGFAALNAAGLLYTFIALYITCDELFVPALDVMSNKLGLSPDVAGATFMAAGGSAPEFFTSLVGSIRPEPSDVGIAAIVGSAIFNVLFVIGACGIAAPGTLQLTGYPLARDSIFYFVDLVLILLFFGYMSPGEVTFLEAAILFLCYVAYCVFMAYSSRVEKYLKESASDAEAKREFTKLDANHDGKLTRDEARAGGVANFDAIDANNDGVVTWAEFRWNLRSRRNLRKQATEKPEDIPEEENDPLSLCPPAGAGAGGIIWYVLTLPLVIVLMFTVPDVRRAGCCWDKLYVAEFILSIVWIAIFSYYMVACTEVVGAFTGIPTNILALTLLAWGTSVPDLLTSVLVTWQGHGDMAVSSSIGSNIFDVTVGLPVPWMIRLAYYGGTFPVGTDGIVSSIGLLLGMLALTIGSIMVNGWVLNKMLGGIMFVLWAIIQVWSIYSFISSESR